jgi:toxin ParE1/3/4
MSVIHKRVLAEQDLIEIWLYTLEAWGEARADEYLDNIDKTLRLLAEQPQLCRLREKFNPPVRIHHCQSHLIAYTEIEGGIEVIRVLHESMDIEGHLDE